MSGYQGHISFYFISVLALSLAIDFLGYSLPDPIDWIFGFFLGAVYSLLADIDSRSSKIRQAVVMSFLVFSIGLLITNLVTDERMHVVRAAFLLTFLLTLYILKHRGRTHSISAAVLLSVPAYLVAPHYAAFALCGYISHLVLDGIIKL